MRMSRAGAKDAWTMDKLVYTQQTMWNQSSDKGQNKHTRSVTRALEACTVYLGAVRGSWMDVQSVNILMKRSELHMK